MKPEKKPAVTPASKNLRVIAVTVALGAAGITAAAGAQTVMASAAYERPTTASVHVAYSYAHLTHVQGHAFGQAKITHLRPRGGGCTGVPTAGIRPACWQLAR